MFSMAMWMAALVTPVQIIAGDQHGLNSLEYQPAKIAAIEGHYTTTPTTPLILVGIPDDAAQETKWALEIPNLGGLILAHDWNASVKGPQAISRRTSVRRRADPVLDVPRHGGARPPDAVARPVVAVGAV